MNAAVVHYYRKFRSENPNYPALAAWNSARSFVYFRKRLGEEAKEHDRRSRTAKRAWKRRKAARS